ncbi:MAG TPA: hypothetical protein VN088_09135 [Nocardioides sp.]|nr:hypothetical protein [Nocardioides sp.]
MSARRWPLALIAAPAAVAIWSGWVGLGGMCGFGLVQPFPGIVRWHLDTAITLPVGVEAYGAYALGAWLRPAAIPARARDFARRSAIGSLALGMSGQVIFHLLAAAHAHRAPWPVTVAVACMPVAVLGFGAGLAHLLRADDPEPAPEAEPEPLPDEPAGEQVPVVVPSDAESAAEASMRATLAAGNPWSVNALMTKFSLPRKTATEIRERALNSSSQPGLGQAWTAPGPSLNGSAPGA